MPLLGQRDPRFVVIYPDGRRSERMDKRTAKDYAKMFGGEVLCVEEPGGIRGFFNWRVFRIMFFVGLPIMITSGYVIGELVISPILYFGGWIALLLVVSRFAKALG